jgi:TnpA family transposase
MTDTRAAPTSSSASSACSATSTPARRRWRRDVLADQRDRHDPLTSLARHQVNSRLVEQHDDLLRVAGSLLQRHTTASQLVRALRSHTRHLASLARALQHVGRAAKTIRLLDYYDDQPFRRGILTQLNRGEGRHALARDVCHGYRGELLQRYRQGQEESSARSA